MDDSSAHFDKAAGEGKMGSRADLTLGRSLFARHLNFPSAATVGDGIARRLAWFGTSSRLPVAERVLQNWRSPGSSRHIMPSLYWLSDVNSRSRQKAASIALRPVESVSQRTVAAAGIVTSNEVHPATVSEKYQTGNAQAQVVERATAVGGQRVLDENSLSAAEQRSDRSLTQPASVEREQLSNADPISRDGQSSSEAIEPIKGSTPAPATVLRRTIASTQKAVASLRAVGAFVQRTSPPTTEEGRRIHSRIVEAAPHRNSLTSGELRLPRSQPNALLATKVVGRSSFEREKVSQDLGAKTNTADRAGSTGVDMELKASVSRAESAPAQVGGETITSRPTREGTGHGTNGSLTQGSAGTGSLIGGSIIGKPTNGGSAVAGSVIAGSVIADPIAGAAIAKSSIGKSHYDGAGIARPHTKETTIAGPPIFRRAMGSAGKAITGKFNNPPTLQTSAIPSDSLGERRQVALREEPVSRIKTAARLTASRAPQLEGLTKPEADSRSSFADVGTVARAITESGSAKKEIESRFEGPRNKSVSRPLSESPSPSLFESVGAVHLQPVSSDSDSRVGRTSSPETHSISRRLETANGATEEFFRFAIANPALDGHPQPFLADSAQLEKPNAVTTRSSPGVLRPQAKLHRSRPGQDELSAGSSASRLAAENERLATQGVHEFSASAQRLPEIIHKERAIEASNNEGQSLATRATSEPSSNATDSRELAVRSQHFLDPANGSADLVHRQPEHSSPHSSSSSGANEELTHPIGGASAAVNEDVATLPNAQIARAMAFEGEHRSNSAASLNRSRPSSLAADSRPQIREHAPGATTEFTNLKPVLAARQADSTVQSTHHHAAGQRVAPITRPFALPLPLPRVSASAAVAGVHRTAGVPDGESVNRASVQGWNGISASGSSILTHRVTPAERSQRAVETSTLEAFPSASAVSSHARVARAIGPGATPPMPTLPTITNQFSSGLKHSKKAEVAELANRVYELLIRRLASERQRRGQ